MARARSPPKYRREPAARAAARRRLDLIWAGDWMPAVVAARQSRAMALEMAGWWNRPDRASPVTKRSAMGWVNPQPWKAR